MTSSNGNIFRVTGPLCGKFTGHWWIPLTKASDGWVNNRDAGDFRRNSAHYDVTNGLKGYMRHDIQCKVYLGYLVWVDNTLLLVSSLCGYSFTTGTVKRLAHSYEILHDWFRVFCCCCRITITENLLCPIWPPPTWISLRRTPHLGLDLLTSSLPTGTRVMTQSCSHGSRQLRWYRGQLWLVTLWAPSQYKDRLIYVWRFPC